MYKELDLDFHIWNMDTYITILIGPNHVKVKINCETLSINFLQAGFNDTILIFKIFRRQPDNLTY